MFKDLRRIITGKEYLAQIDGLRFFAILYVVIFHILANYRLHIDSKIKLPIIDFIIKKIHLGYLGVVLFFVISGFILAIPFIKAMNNDGTLSLKSYYLRRLTRLEPPYFLIMTTMAFVFILIKNIDAFTILKHYFASFFYLHYLFFPTEEPLLNGVAWSLEVEIQFYFLTPLLTKVFLLEKKTRRLILLFSIIFFSILSSNYMFKYFILLNQIHFFIIGYLLADLFLDKDNNFNIKNYVVFLLYILILFPFRNYFGNCYGTLLLVIILFITYHNIIHNKLKFIFQNKVIAIIGGMCYSIYLIHLPIIGFFNILFKKFQLFQNNLVSLFTFIVLNIFFISVLSLLYYKYIERPCMNPNWYKKYLTKF